MTVHELTGYVLALIVGISLGMMGSGGSILTVPVLVYIMAVSPVLATAYSLFIVGTTALVGSIRNAFDKNIDFRKAFIFGLPSIISVYLTRSLIIPAIPEHIGNIGAYRLEKPMVIMILFAIVMIAASFTMLRTNKFKNQNIENQHIKYNYPVIFFLGITIGIIAGLVGAGGGFLIVPTLVILAKTPMKKAVGTSLLIVAFQSLIGFSGDSCAAAKMDWKLLLTFTACAVCGIFIGLILAKKTPPNKLKKSFGWFVLIMGIYIISREIWFH